MTSGQRLPTAGSTIVLIGDLSSTVDIEDGLHTCPDIGSVISVESVDTALDILESVSVQCLVSGLTRTGQGSERVENSAEHDDTNQSGSDAGSRSRTGAPGRPGEESESPERDGLGPSTGSIERLVAAAGDRPVIAVTEANAEQVLEAGAHDVIGPHTPLEAAVARILNAAERYRLESITVAGPTPPSESLTTLGSIPSDPQFWPSFESVIREASLAHDDLRTERDRLESLLHCLYAAWWRLGRAESRSQVERRLCEALSSIENADLVWVGRLTPEVLEVTPETWVGGRDEYLKEQSYSLEGTDLSPAAATTASGSRTLIEETTTQPSESRWARTALEHGIRSICSVPIDFQGITYGCLTVCSTEPAAFDQWTVDSVSALAEVGGVLINRLELRSAVYADQMVELEVLVETGDDPLTVLAEYLDQRVDIETVVARSTFGSVGTISVSSISEENETALSSAIEGVRSVQTMTGDPDSTRMQVQFAERTIADSLADHGAVVRSLEPVGNRVRITVELPADRSVRRVVQFLEDEVSNTELITRRSERSPRDQSGRFEDRLEKGLTERQRQTLETAYYNGYFDWPRERTGEEIADALGVSQPTFTRHFRTAQRKLFELLFDQ
ncbi:bacterio-opsin activator domain-containing protein [Halostagnicola bangensis]